VKYHVNHLSLGLVSLLFWLTINPASAVIVTDFGIDTITQRYVIDPAVSTATYDPGLVPIIVDENGNPISQPPSPQTYAVSGHFNALFSRYWWQYVVPQDDGSRLGPFDYEQYWLRFADAQLDGLDNATGFVFPKYFLL
jgi:hypothetical protein